MSNTILIDFDSTKRVAHARSSPVSRARVREHSPAHARTHAPNEGTIDPAVRPSVGVCRSEVRLSIQKITQTTSYEPSSRDYRNNRTRKKPNHFKRIRATA
jgi:hypothetical protein